eukprot:scaffold16487_cov91-Isochrysis_galbana.AAC.2
MSSPVCERSAAQSWNASHLRPAQLCKNMERNSATWAGSRSQNSAAVSFRSGASGRTTIGMPRSPRSSAKASSSETSSPM